MIRLSIAPAVRTNIYIDGFNFYYGCFKNLNDPVVAANAHAGTPYKWVDLRALGHALFPTDHIQRIRLFSARPIDDAVNPDQSLRQETWFRALRSYSNVKIELGTHQERPKTGRLLTNVACAAPVSCLPFLLKVMTREEKGSDVNLASWLLKDAFLDDCDRAVVISNDSDLETAVRIAKFDARKEVIVVSPYLTVVKALRKASTSSFVLDKAWLPHCQLPDPTPDKRGFVTKPLGW